MPVGNGMRLWAAVATLAVLVLGAACRAEGGGYPARAIDMVVAFPPGGATDIVARSLGEVVSKKWNQPINIINKAGGGGATGTLEVAQAKADGYSLLMHVTGAGALSPALQTTLPYKWDQFTFIARVNTNPVVFTVKGDSKWKTLKDVLDEVKKDPTKYKYGTAAPGGPSTFAIALAMEAAGIDPNKLSKVVMAGGAPVVQAVAGGHVDFAAQNLSEVVELVKGGQLRGLAISSEVRAKALPDVPTGKEAEYPQFVFQGWNGLVGPLNLPKEVVDRWDQIIKETVSDKAFADKLEGLGALPAYLGPVAFKSEIQKQYEWALATATKMGLRQ